MDWIVFWTAAGVVAAVMAPLIGQMAARLQANKKTNEFTIEDYTWVLEKGITYEGFLLRLLGLDRATLPGLTERSAGNEKTKAPVFEKSPETWRLVVFRDHVIVGHWSCFSISENLQQRLKDGGDVRFRDFRLPYPPHSGRQRACPVL